VCAPCLPPLGELSLSGGCCAGVRPFPLRIPASSFSRPPASPVHGAGDLPLGSSKAHRGAAGGGGTLKDPRQAGFRQLGSQRGWRGTRCQEVAAAAAVGEPWTTHHPGPRPARPGLSGLSLCTCPQPSQKRVPKPTPRPPQTSHISSSCLSRGRLSFFFLLLLASILFGVSSSHQAVPGQGLRARQ
jgi:hypothetical protein